MTARSSHGSVSRATPELHRRTTWAVLGTALVARLLMLWSTLVVHPHTWLYSRGIEMGLLADSLLRGHGYSSPFGGSTGPTAFIAPGYPTLIAGIFLLFGTYSFPSAIAIMAFQILVSLVTIWLMMHIAREVLDEQTAVLAGLFWALSLPILFIPTIFWETSLSACAMVGLIAAALRCDRVPSLRLWIALGAGCGVVALVNPALLPSILAILGWIAWATWKRLRMAPLLGLLALLLVYSPWPIRNAYRFHAFLPTRTTVGFELWMGNRPGATGYLNESLFPMYDKQELASYIAKGELAYTRDKSDAAKTYILAHPGIFAHMTLRRIIRFWTGTGNNPGSIFYAIHALVTSGFGFAALLLLYRGRRRAFAMLMALPLLLFPIPYYITHAEFRYRLVIDPIMTILAAYAVTQFADRLHVAAEE
jgi:4-amino-4-deoxy-L-arabinose transferase-like glycosyltransferase